MADARSTPPTPRRGMLCSRTGCSRLLSALTAVVLFAGLAGLLWEYGFGVDPATATRLHRLHLGVAAAFLVLKLLRIAVAPERVAYLRSHWLDYTLIFVLGVQFVVYLMLQRTPEFRFLRETGQLGALAVVYLAVLQLGLVAAFALRSTYFHRGLIRLRLKPAQSLALSFIVAIVIGTLLLLLPRAGAGGVPLTLREASFTSVSAVCVTGLTVLEPGIRLSTFGQWILLALIQAGGLGILTLTALLVDLSGAAPRAERAALARALDAGRVEELGSLVRSVAALTLVIELIGAGALYLAWAEQIPGRLIRTQYAVFHAISGFCNAGFALFPGNLEHFTSDLAVGLTLIVMITAGGLGFGVLSALLQRGLRASVGLSIPRLSNHARIVLATSGLLLVAGAVLFWACERGGVLAGLPPAQQWLAAVFQSATLRTAGFNTVPFAAIAPATILLCLLWMAIGGSPGSASGGCKTTTVAVLASGLTRGRVLGVAIAPETFRAAARLAGTYAAAFVGATLALCLLEGRWTGSLVFESMSALGTVGLSLGETTRVGDPALVVLMITMVIGRIGPVVAAMALVAPGHVKVIAGPADRAGQPRLG